jgi:hypothetical protein
VSQPTQTCTTCGDVEVVTPDGRGFPPDIAARRLAKRCKLKGHTSTAQYRAGIEMASRVGTSTAFAAPAAAESRQCPGGCDFPMTRHVDADGPYWRCPECLTEWDEADLDPVTGS